jgi:AcrR family transcriptional regulator
MRPCTERTFSKNLEEVTGMDEAKSPMTRQCILEAAQRLFATHGYHGASIRDIVQACGISNAALYYHFESKQNLYFEVLGEYVAAIVDRLQKADTGTGTCRSRLTRVALAFARIILESQNVLQTLMRDLSEFDRADIARRLPGWSNRIPAPIISILEDGIIAGQIRPVPPRHTGIILMGMVNSMAVRHLYNQVETTLEEDVDLVIHVLFEGIAI